MQWALWSHKDPRERTFQQPILVLDLAWKNPRREESLAGFLTVTVLEAEKLCTSTGAQGTVQMGCYFNCTMSCYWQSHGLLPSDHHEEIARHDPPTISHTHVQHTPIPYSKFAQYRHSAINNSLYRPSSLHLQCLWLHICLVVPLDGGSCLCLPVWSLTADHLWWSEAPNVQWDRKGRWVHWRSVPLRAFIGWAIAVGMIIDWRYIKLA